MVERQQKKDNVEDKDFGWLRGLQILHLTDTFERVDGFYFKDTRAKQKSLFILCVRIVFVHRIEFLNKEGTND